MRMLTDLQARLQFDPLAARRFEDGRQGVEQRLLREVDRLLGESAERSARPQGSRHLVMGLAAHYGIAELAAFVLSLRRSGFSGDVVLLTYGCTAQTAAFLRANNVRMVPFTGISGMPMSMNSARMFRYLDWLLEAYLNSPDAIPYGQILLTDIRDVVFQSDPFAEAPAGRVQFFLETDRTIGSCPINRDWMCRAYGEAVANELAHAPVSCAGTVMGSPDGLVEYLAHMIRDIVRVPLQHRFSGVDQAIHNHMLARRLIPGAVAVSNGGRVMTVPSDNATGMQVLPDGRITNPDGQVSAVVHQYDRHADLTAAVASRYRV